MRAETTVQAEPAKLSRAAMAVLTGMLVGIVASLVMLLIFSFVMTMRDVPQGFVATLTAVSVALGSFAGGLTGAKLHGKSGLAIGAITGICMYFLLMLAGIIMQGNGLGVSVIIKLIVSFASGGIGGIIGVNARKNGRR